MTITAINHHVDVQPAARDAAVADQHVKHLLPACPAGMPAAGASDLVLELATHRAADPDFRALWEALVMAGDSPQKIYQTPQFFSLLQQLPKAADSSLEVLAVVRLSDAAIVGVVPDRIMKYDMGFNVGPLVLYTAKVTMIGLLGSVPAAPAGVGAVQYLAAQMLALFPAACAIHMPAVPAHSRHWESMAAFSGSGQLSASLMGAWRDCHTLPLPETFDKYLAKFSSKKRYNLNRQVRQLAERAGPLELFRIERADQVPDMLSAIAALGTAAEVATTLSRETFTGMAGCGLLLCYAVYAGDEPVGVVVGTRSPKVLHVHKIFVEKKYLALSIGTSVMHLAIEDITSLNCFDGIDFGYGEPQSDFRSSHLIETRAAVLLYDRMRSVSLFFFVHGVFSRSSDAMVAAVKWIKATARTLRRAKIA